MPRNEYQDHFDPKATVGDSGRSHLRQQDCPAFVLLQRRKYPAQVWRKNDLEVRKVITSNKQISSIKLDPDKETADIDTSNNSWPKEENESDFDKFKSNIKG